MSTSSSELSIAEPPAVLRREAPQREAASRRRLLDAAARLFAERGFRSVTVRDVSAAAGLTHTAVRHHFGGKAGLYREVLERRGPRPGALDWSFGEERGEPGDVEDARERVRSWIMGLARTVIVSRDPVADGLLVQELLHGSDGAGGGVLQGHLAGQRAQFEELLGAARPELADPDERRLVAASVIAHLVHLRLTRPVLLELLGVERLGVSEGRALWEQLVHAAVSMALDGPVGALERARRRYDANRDSGPRDAE